MGPSRQRVRVQRRFSSILLAGSLITRTRQATRSSAESKSSFLREKLSFNHERKCFSGEISLQLSADCRNDSLLLLRCFRTKPSFIQLKNSNVTFVYNRQSNFFFFSKTFILYLQREKKNTRTNKNICLHTRTHEK